MLPVVRNQLQHAERAGGRQVFAGHQLCCISAFCSGSHFPSARHLLPRCPQGSSGEWLPGGTGAMGAAAGAAPQAVLPSAERAVRAEGRKVEAWLTSPHPSICCPGRSWALLMEHIQFRKSTASRLPKCSFQIKTIRESLS